MEVRSNLQTLMAVYGNRPSPRTFSLLLDQVQVAMKLLAIASIIIVLAILQQVQVLLGVTIKHTITNEFYGESPTSSNIINCINRSQ